MSLNMVVTSNEVWMRGLQLVAMTVPTILRQQTVKRMDDTSRLLPLYKNEAKISRILVLAFCAGDVIWNQGLHSNDVWWSPAIEVPSIHWPNPIASTH